MAEPDEAAKSPTYGEIYVTGQVSNTSCDGISMAALHESQHLWRAANSGEFKISVVTNKQIGCTLNSSQNGTESWSALFRRNLERYESMFGPIMSPEEIAEKFRQSSPSSRF